MFPYAVMRNKSATLKNGTWFLTVYLPKCADKYRYYLSPDCGETFEFHEGAKKLSECEYPEPMVVERKDGSLDFYARTYTSRIAKSVSADGGNT